MSYRGNAKSGCTLPTALKLMLEGSVKLFYCIVCQSEKTLNVYFQKVGNFRSPTRTGPH
jgi:hypothetical protein